MKSSTNPLSGIAKDKNLIILQMEAINNFVIDLEIDLQKVVPVLVTPSYINDQIEYC